MNPVYDAIVVGAGPGGSAAAALLANAGKRVLLVDKNRAAGGRMMTLHSEEGFHYELLPINGCPAEGSQMDAVWKSVGQSGDRRPSPESLIGGLYHVGNDAGGFGLGTQQAVDSAVNVVGLVERKKNG